jgi:opacity protein-like surface antigen
MYSLAGKLGLAILLAALCLGGRTAHAQSAPVPYTNSNWFLGLGGNPGFDGSDASGGVSRTNFPSGWFVGNTRSDFGMSGFNRAAAFGNFGSLSSEGVQFGYTLKNTPLSIYAGFDTLKYNTGASAGSSAFAAFDSRSTTAPGAFSANAGIEYRPTSNLSLSLGVGVTQYQSQGLVDSDINSPLLPGQSPLAIGGVRR